MPFARIYNHPATGLIFIKAFDTLEEALAYQNLNEPNEPLGKSPVLVVELASFVERELG